MSIDQNGDLTPNNFDPQPSSTETATPMFAPIPSWERNRKRRGFGGGKSRVAATTMAATAPRLDVVDRPLPGETVAVADTAALESDSTVGTETAYVAPSYATRTTTRKTSAAPVAIAAGVIALGGLAAAGWYASQPHDTGVAELTPGVPATAPAAPAAMDMAANTSAPPPALPAATTPAAAPARSAQATPAPRAQVRVAQASRPAAARARPAAAARSVEDAGVNTSATLPSAPQPYSGAAQPPTAAAAPMLDVPPAAAPAAAPATAPTSATPPVTTP